MPAWQQQVLHSLERSKVIPSHASPRCFALSFADANAFGVRDGDRMSLRIGGRCGVILQDLLVRADATSKLEVHIDTDEGNAADLDNATSVELITQD